MKIDPEKRSVALKASRKLYSDDAVRVAAHVFDSRAEIYHAAGKDAHALTLVAKRKDADLEALGGEFMNELLNQEYRFLVGRFNRKIADRIVATTLLAARGGENPPPPPPDTPELAAERARLLAEAEEEIARTMPKRIAPQGSPIKPPEDDAR